MAVAVREMLNQERDARRAVLEPWHCDGTLRDGRPCRKILMELDMERPSYIRKVCERCHSVNFWVEARGGGSKSNG